MTPELHKLEDVDEHVEEALRKLARAVAVMEVSEREVRAAWRQAMDAGASAQELAGILPRRLVVELRRRP